MGLVSLSDIHIKEPCDTHAKMFCRFLDHERTRKASTIVLLGDIFDLMVGPYPEYVKKFRPVFEKLDELAKTKKIYYFQGNHDFHLMDMFKKQTLFEHIGKIIVCRSGRILSLGRKKIYVEHGDDAEVGNHSYKIYKKMINNFLLALVAKHLLNIRVIEFIGNRLSALSRKRNEQKYGLMGEDFIQEVREKFRESARKIVREKKCDGVVLGHAHIKDHYKMPEGRFYLNNGYAPREGCFCVLSEEGEMLEDICP